MTRLLVSYIYATQDEVNSQFEEEKKIKRKK